MSQSNEAKTTSSADNSNSTHQSNNQQQQGQATAPAPQQGSDGGSSRDRGHGCAHRGRPSDGGHGQDQRPGAPHAPKVGQQQTAGNSNSTSQQAGSSAVSEQKNVNKPFSLLSFGGGQGPWASSCGNGCASGAPVRQSNEAITTSKAQNTNSTGQHNQQDQQGSAA